MAEELVYLNGALVPKSQAKISALDYGFLYGYGLFETMRAYGGSIFRLDNHLARLAGSTQKLAIAVDAAVLKEAVLNTLEANALNARVRLAVSIGEGSFVPDPKSCTVPTVLVVAANYTPLPDDAYKSGYRVNVSTIRRNSESPVAAMKTANYLESLLARQEAKAAGVDDTLFLNEKGQVAEASTSNFFLVSGNTLKTPDKSSGILPGITRGLVLQLALRAGIKTLECDIRIEEMRQADEAFLTNSIMELMPVTSVAGRTLGDGSPGPVTKRLMAAYKELVAAETHSPA